MDSVQTKIHEAMTRVARRHPLVYDPRLLEGYDGYDGPLDHRKQLRELLGRELVNLDAGFIVEYEFSCEPVYKAPKRKRAKKGPPKIDLMVELRHQDAFTRKRTVNRYAVSITVANPPGSDDEGIIVTRHGRSGGMGFSRLDDLAYSYICDLGNLEAWVNAGDFVGGFALLYSPYDGWKEGVDPHYPHEGRTLEGEVSRPKQLLRKSSPAIELTGSYPLEWSTYSEIPETPPAGQRAPRGDTVNVEGGLDVRYLLVPVAPAAN